MKKNTVLWRLPCFGKGYYKMSDYGTDGKLQQVV